MKLLIAITSCENDEQRGFNDPIRETWLPEAVSLGIPYKFFHGTGSTPKDDVIILDCLDDYLHVTGKLRGKMQWALAQGYDYLFSAGTDTYAQPGRVLTCGFEKYDCFGAVFNHWSYEDRILVHPDAGVFLSHRAMELVANDLTPVASVEGPIDATAVDACAWLGQALTRAGIKPEHSEDFCIFAHDGPRVGNTVIANHLSLTDPDRKYKPEQMYQKHREWLEGK